MRKQLLMIGLTVGTVLLPAIAEDQKKPAKTVQTKVIDPVCGMEVDPKTAEKAVYQGKEYYFCSRDEKAAFEKTPEKYLAKAKKK